MKYILLILIQFPIILYSQNTEKVSKWIEKSIAELEKAKISEEDKDYSKALVYIDKGLKENSTDPEIFFIKGLIHQMWGKVDYNSDKFKNAIDNYSNAIRLDSTYANAYLNRGLAHFDIGKYAYSQSDYDNARINGCASYALNYNYALLLKTTHNPTQGSVWASFALQMTNLSQSEKVDSYNLRGSCYLETKEYEKAKADFDSVLVYDTSHTRATMNLGLANHYLGEYKSAIILFTKAIDLPNNEDFIQFIYNNLANTFLKLNEPHQACKYWHLAIDNGYVYDPIWKAEYGIDNPIELIKTNCKK